MPQFPIYKIEIYVVLFTKEELKSLNLSELWNDYRRYKDGSREVCMGESWESIYDDKTLKKLEDWFNKQNTIN
jgi:hypothetical protein